MPACTRRALPRRCSAGARPPRATCSTTACARRTSPWSPTRAAPPRTVTPSTTATWCAPARRTRTRASSTAAAPWSCRAAWPASRPGPTAAPATATPASTRAWPRSTCRSRRSRRRSRGRRLSARTVPVRSTPLSLPGPVDDLGGEAGEGVRDSAPGELLVPGIHAVGFRDGRVMAVVDRSLPHHLVGRRVEEELFAVTVRQGKGGSAGAVLHLFDRDAGDRGHHAIQRGLGSG